MASEHLTGRTTTKTPPPTSRDAEPVNTGEDRRMKVEDDLDIGGGFFEDLTAS